MASAPSDNRAFNTPINYFAFPGKHFIAVTIIQPKQGNQ